ncbi:MAG TPA: DUF167 domain-containing protein [bacterium]|nr:DUF167 domain-containing protein [bacterium]HOL49188.1 DUF167 domain-containing protein [bacterium]HPO52198.1 DUF167 domain-containing protein [bacterium]
MKISAKVKTLSREEKISQVEPGKFIVHVKTPPIEGKANEEVIKIISKFFKVPKSKVRIIAGHKSKNKIIEVLQ